MAILQSVTYGGQTFEVPDKLSELSDVNVPANAANGSILALQNGKWVPVESITDSKLTGLNTSQGGAVTAADTVLSAIGKLANLQNGFDCFIDLTDRFASGDPEDPGVMFYNGGIQFRKRWSHVWFRFVATTKAVAAGTTCRIRGIPQMFVPTSLSSGTTNGYTFNINNIENTIWIGAENDMQKDALEVVREYDAQ